MGKEAIVINEDFKMKVVNFLKIYGTYDGILVKHGNDKKYISGDAKIDDIINNKIEFNLLKNSINMVFEYCYENSYKAIEDVIDFFYKYECKDIRIKYGNFFDKF